MLKLGHDVEFFRMLEAQAAVAQRSAAAFLALTQDFARLDAGAEELKRLENEGDDLTRRLQAKILSTFMTPLDKEDLRALSNALDDVTDDIEAAAHCKPPLTTVKMDKEALGYVAARALIEGDVAPNDASLPVELVVRESSVRTPA